jgi:hypothetical protein
MTYFIFARDGASRIVLKRESREAAEKKARELTDLGWFEVQIEELESRKEITSRTATHDPAGLKIRMVARRWSTVANADVDICFNNQR